MNRSSVAALGGSRPELSADDDGVSVTADVLVIGGGLAGSWAAVRPPPGTAPRWHWPTRARVCPANVFERGADRVPVNRPGAVEQANYSHK
jgi:hypothetical protein